MSENRCERCSRKLKDPNAQYGWRCAEILGVSEDLNYSGDSAFDRYLLGISAADSFLADNRTDKKSVNQASFYEAMAKRYLSADMHNHALWKAAYTQSENALKGNESTNNTPLSEYFDLRDAYDYKSGDYQTTKYLDGTYSEDTKKLQHALNEIGIRDKFGNKLKEDGLNGPKTHWATDILFKGASPSLSYISPLQTGISNVGIRKPSEHTIIKEYRNALKHNRDFITPADQLFNIKTQNRLFHADKKMLPATQKDIITKNRLFSFKNNITTDVNKLSIDLEPDIAWRHINIKAEPSSSMFAKEISKNSIILQSQIQHITYWLILMTSLKLLKKVENPLL